MTTVSYVATTPKPRLVHLEIIPQGEEPFSNGIYEHRAVRYVVKVKIGGVAGVVSPLVGKQPPDTRAWILGDDAPAFVKFDGPLLETGLFGGWDLLFQPDGRGVKMRHALRNRLERSDELRLQ
jgi:hypothetical protein